LSKGMLVRHTSGWVGRIIKIDGVILGNRVVTIRKERRKRYPEA
jgi:hypothetical protein